PYPNGQSLNFLVFFSSSCSDVSFTSVVLTSLRVLARLSDYEWLSLAFGPNQLDEQHLQSGHS
ncbi:hypothetical protein, partial [Limosilactobacillus reuteri]|uniref:hypothetical protein n=1 Tax=Limosilactobacillus reuteri TaxID=1598 RepID=UPI001CDD7AC0